MNRYHLIAFTLIAFAPGAFSQVANTAESVQVEATTGPVTVVSHQPEALAKASEYKVNIADFDTNGDRQLSRREVPATHALSYEFHIVDRNHNGFITDAELTAGNWK